MRFAEVPPVYQHLIRQAQVVNDPHCFQRLATNPAQNAYMRYHAAHVWLLKYRETLTKLGVISMAKNTNGQSEFRGFINIHLTDADKEKIAASASDPQGIMDNLAGLLFEGYKVSLAYDVKSGAIQAVLTCWNPDSAHFGYAISSRHPEAIVALDSLLYKHFDLAAEQWLAIEQPPALTKWD